MALYIAVDEGYYPTKLNSQKEVFELTERYFKRDGTKYTQKDIKDKGNYPLRLWDLTEEEREDILSGCRNSKEWEYIIHKL